MVRQGDWYVMFYIGFSDPRTAQIGLARSKDGISGWHRYPANPIIRVGKGQWDEDACYKPFAVYDGRKWLLWYNGRRGDLEQIGVAIHEGEDLGFGSGRAAGTTDTGSLTAVPFQNVRVAELFWSLRLATNRKVTVEANLRQCEVTGRIRNFAVAAKLAPGKFEGQRYNNSDIYKVLKGIAYTLAGRRRIGKTGGRDHRQDRRRPAVRRLPQHIFHAGQAGRALEALAGQPRALLRRPSLRGGRRLLSGYANASCWMSLASSPTTSTASLGPIRNRQHPVTRRLN